ncbi:MAG: hypothetical protein F6K23_16490 [Okeania sp. SIO2C9]|uniref:hypothetical protein n=1 Tax=Okeania sp. SIO2C9 TaxID=2607791 RepID=UPI0013C10212|nr:hypothetical protein [Okeania sp. SIO2C9]NEQ74490.1 hypothetical protein [Okeania sp. SIO2C9]
MLAEDKLKLDKITLIGYILIVLAITIGFITRIFAVFQYVTFDIGPDPDQIRDAFTVMKIWEGQMPTLGPSSTVGGYHILPLYYYLFFPFTLLGANPAFQAFPNSLFSFLSIPLLGYLVYELLENISTPKRILFGSLASFWYSVIFPEIFISNFQWNPCSIPFFLLIFTLLFKYQMESRGSFLFSAILWIFSGITLAILVSLHSSTMFVMPLVFIISCLIFLIKNFRRNKKSILLPILAAFSALITLLPYWIGEVSRGFRNTKLIIKTVIGSSGGSESGILVSLWEKIYRIFSTYFLLGQQTYFFGSSVFYLAVSIVFMSLVTYLAIAKFRGNKNIWYILGITWIIYLYAASNLDKANFIFYYKLLILFSPIILTVVSLGYLDYSRTVNKVIAAFIGICIIFSTVTNLGYEYRFLLSKYGSNRLMNTGELTQLLRQIPENSTICDPKVKRKRASLNQYNYIDSYITNRGIKVVDDCQKGNYVIHPKRVILINGNFLVDKTYTNIYLARFEGLVSNKLWPMFEVIDNDKIERKYQPFLETQTAYVYILD